MPVYGSTFSTSDPISGRKYLIGGIAVFVSIVAILILVFILTSGGKDSFVLDRTPLFAGRNNLPQNLERLINNNLTLIDLNSDLRNDTKFGANCSRCNTDFSRLKEGQVSSQFWVATAGCTEETRIKSAFTQIDVVIRMIKKYSNLQMIKSSKDLESVFENKHLGSLIAVDGGQSLLGATASLRMFYALGVRALTLANKCELPNVEDHIVENGTLTDFGTSAVMVMNKLGIIIDIQGLPTEAQSKVLNISVAPVMVSHTAAAGLYNYSGNLDDSMLDSIKTNNGLIMISFDTVNFGSTDNINKSEVVNHINYIVDKIGFENIAIGGNYDSDLGKPTGLEDVSDFPRLFRELKDTNGTKWTPDNLDKLAGLNFDRFFRDVEKFTNSTNSGAV